MEEPSQIEPIEQLIVEVERAVEARLWRLCMMGALTLPDICSALRSDNGESPRNAYAAWWNEYHKPEYDGKLDGQMCYEFRCRLLHQLSGVTRYSYTGKHGHYPYWRLGFTVPPSDPSLPTVEQHLQVYQSFGNLTEDGERYDRDPSVLTVHAPRFCADVIDSVKAWMRVESDSENVRRNVHRLLTHLNDDHAYTWYHVSGPQFI